MDIAALITWLVTAAGGFALLARWLSQGGHKPGSGSRLAPGVVFGHFGLAVVGLVLWIVFLVNDSSAIAWTAFIVLLPVALLGFAMFARWLGTVRGGAAAGAGGTSGAPEAGFPVVVVVAHGLFAATTLVLVLLTALNA